MSVPIYDLIAERNFIPPGSTTTPGRVVYPVINLARPCFADISFGLSNMPGDQSPPPIIDLTVLDYTDRNTTRFFHLTGNKPLARVRGHYQAQGSVTMGLEAYRIMIGWLTQGGGSGYGDVSFDITVQYAMTQSSPILTDQLLGVKIIGSGQKNAHGGNDLDTTVELSITRIVWSGNDMSTELFITPLPAGTR